MYKIKIDFAQSFVYLIIFGFILTAIIASGMFLYHLITSVLQNGFNISTITASVLIFIIAPLLVIAFSTLDKLD